MMEKGSDAAMIRNLTSTGTDEIVGVANVEVKQRGWTVEKLLELIARHANPTFNALIDTGALITGLTNEEVARALLATGLDGIDVCVFFDDDGRQLFVDRNGGSAAPLSRCGVSKEKRFAFYDQVHTTGTDLKHKLDAVAAVTLGKDMTLRDYTQGCYRMRGIGKGQRIFVIMIQEIQQLVLSVVDPVEASRVEGGGAPRALLPPDATGYAAEQQKTLIDVIAWLVVNSLRSEDLQHLQLIRQNLMDVWRSESYNQLLMSRRPPLVLGDEIVDDENAAGAAKGGEVHHADSKDAVDALLKGSAGKLVVLDQYATWCGPCTAIAPAFAAMAAEFKNVVFAKVDGDQYQLDGVTGFPTFQFWLDGKMVDSFSGADEAKLRSSVETYKTDAAAGASSASASGATGDDDDGELQVAHPTAPLLQNRFLNALSGLALESAMGNAPELISKIMADAQKSTISWEHLTDSGWHAYPDEVTVKLETEYRLNHATVRISVLSEGWTVQFTKDGGGIERPVGGGSTERAVRRVQHDSEAEVKEKRVFEATKVVSWNAGRYPPYDDALQKIIEAAFQAHQPEVHVSIQGRGGYRILFSYDGGQHTQSTFLFSKQVYSFMF
jgi:thiol-disulfide isomerase/thioredoxin